MDSIEHRLHQLELRVSAGEKLNQTLLSRVCELEDQQEHLLEQLKRVQNQNVELQESIKQSKQAADEVEETWLYYCEMNRKTNSIVNALQVKSQLVYEFQYMKWNDCESMWMDLIGSINKQLLKQHMNTKQTIRQIGVDCLRQHMNDELLLIIRGVPSGVKQKLSILVELCESVTGCWNEIELDQQGRILVVLESAESMDKLEYTTGDDHKVLLFIEKLQ